MMEPAQVVLAVPEATSVWFADFLKIVWNKMACLTLMVGWSNVRQCLLRQKPDYFINRETLPQ